MELEAVSPALKRALAMLRRRDYFRDELRTALLAKSCTEADVDRTLAWLDARGLLQDVRTVSNYVEKRSGFAIARLREELEMRGVPLEIIDHALATENDAERAEAALAEKPQAVRSPERAARFLASRGFSAETIESLVEFPELLS